MTLSWGILKSGDLGGFQWILRTIKSKDSDCDSAGNAGLAGQWPLLLLAIGRGFLSRLCRCCFFLCESNCSGAVQLGSRESEYSRLAVESVWERRAARAARKGWRLVGLQPCGEFRCVVAFGYVLDQRGAESD